MARNHNKLTLVIALCCSASAMAGDWTFTPSIALNETFTNNIKLTNIDHIGSFVTQTTAGIQTKFDSRLVNFSLDSTSTYAMYSHDHSLDDNYRTLNAQGKIFLWADGPALIVSSTIANISRNKARNSLADLISRNTIESKNNEVGLVYTRKNNHFNIDGKISYLTRRNNDNIGNTQGYRGSLETRNGNNAKTLLWQLKSNYLQQNNAQFTGNFYNIEALLGVITPIKLNPFIRYFNENSSGNIATNRSAGTASWGPGIRWHIGTHLYVDASYNFPKDKTKSSNYVAAAINWQPSARTSLEANYSKRFFGNSYDLKFSHQLRRLTNQISYTEQLQAFDRNNYQRVNLGNFWCPSNAGNSNDLSSCFANSNTSIDFTNYRLVSLLQQVLVPSNEFSLNKTLNWQSTLKLSRTTFNFSAYKNSRESLTTNRKEQSESANLSIQRRISEKGSVSIKAGYQHRVFDQNNLATTGQQDYYRSLTTAYNRKLAKSLSVDFSLTYLNRTSTELIYTYNETRAIINLKKDF